MNRNQPMKRAQMRRRSRRVSAAERKVYEQATEAARDASGTLICAICHACIQDGSEHRDHIRSRGAGGKTVLENIQILHPWCHEMKHCQPWKTEKA